MHDLCCLFIPSIHCCSVNKNFVKVASGGTPFSVKYRLPICYSILDIWSKIITKI